MYIECVNMLLYLYIFFPVQFLLLSLDFAGHEYEKNITKSQSSQYKENSSYFTYIRILRKAV